MPLWRDYSSHHGPRVLQRRRVGVFCRGCQWRGYRVARFSLDVGQRFDTAHATGDIKGLAAPLKCPSCGKSRVVYTHTAGLV